MHQKGSTPNRPDINYINNISLVNIYYHTPIAGAIGVIDFV